MTTLAQRCFDAQNQDEELWSALEKITPGLLDCWVDAYDSSVEVVLDKDATPMTREQADSILALGFGCVYESPAGLQWCSTYAGKAAAKETRSEHGGQPIWRNQRELVHLRERMALIEKYPEQVMVIRLDKLKQDLPQGLITDKELLSDVITAAEFMPRGLMEKDFRYKQIIAYGVVTYKRRYLMHTRSTKVGESRLLGAGSIGLGGHVESVDGVAMGIRSDGNYYWHYGTILQAMDREIREEVDLPNLPEDEPVCSGMINDDSTEVGRVHIGVLFEYAAACGACLPRDPAITDLLWVDLDTLHREVDTLETWSQIYVRHKTATKLQA